MRAAIFAAFLLAACGANAAREELPPPQLPQRMGVDPLVAARAEGIEFRAVGDGFVLDIFRDERIRLTLDKEGELLFAKPEPRFPRWNGSIYETANEGYTLAIEIRDDRPCRGENRATYPTTVHILLNELELSGCGRRF